LRSKILDTAKLAQEAEDFVASIPNYWEQNKTKKPKMQPKMLKVTEKRVNSKILEVTKMARENFHSKMEKITVVMQNMIIPHKVKIKHLTAMEDHQISNIGQIVKILSQMAMEDHQISKIGQMVKILNSKLDHILKQINKEINLSFLVLMLVIIMHIGVNKCKLCQIRVNMACMVTQQSLQMKGF
jgi:hypothetical protein